MKAWIWYIRTPYCLHIEVCLTTRILPIRSFVPVRLRHGDAALSVSSRLARMTVSPRRSSAMMLRVYGRHSSLSTRKGLLPQRATRKRPENNQSKQEDSVLELVKETPFISRKEISGRLGLHDSSIKRRLASLQRKGVIKRVGPDKGGHWEVLD